MNDDQVAQQPHISEANMEIYTRLLLHPLTEFNEVIFLDLLQFSLSLSVIDKKRVIDAIPTLSQYQIDELHKVFQDERVEFKKLIDKEEATIRDLVKKASEGWGQLIEIYIAETKNFQAEMQDQERLNSLKAALEEEV